MIYDSGIVEIYRLPGQGDGNLPSKEGELIGRAYFANRTVGFNRYYTARANSDRIDRLIQLWPIPGVDTGCIAKIGSEKYNILQVQCTEDDDRLPVILLSLEAYDDTN